MHIKFALGHIFIDETDFQRLDQNLTLSMPLIPQYTIDDYEAAQALADAACSGAKTFSILTFVVCLCLGYGLKYLWNTINVL